VPVKNRLVLLLTAAAGYVDAISYLALGRVFTANMTGNTVLLGVSLAEGDLGGSGRTLLALGGFLAGGAIGARLVARAPRPATWPRGVTLALAAEAVLLLALAAAQTSALAADATHVAARVALAAVAMGIQSAAARRLDVSGVATTFVTGTLTTLIALIAVHGVVPGAGTQSKRLLAAVWAVYVVGALVATAVLRLVPAAALVAPVLAVLAVTLVAGRRDWAPDAARP
jgi:uncharacterized membrane protein YoaK (UPF0700 family)